jgi:hypothetical protein
LEDFTEDITLVNRMAQINHKIIVLSGKGGVGFGPFSYRAADHGGVGQLETFYL